MKTKLLALLFLFLPLTAAAQTSASADVQVTATVVEALSVSALGPLDYGTVMVSQSTYINPKTSSNAVKIDVVGADGQDVTITWTSASTFSPEITKGGDQSASAIITSGHTATLDPVILWLGGTVTPSTTGSYSSTLTLTAEYTSL